MTVNRRSMLRTAAVALPVAAVAATVPTAAAAEATDAQKAAIDAAFADVAANPLYAYWTEPSNGLANGFSKVPSFNVVNNSNYKLQVATKTPLSFSFAAVRASGVATLPNGPLSVSTSWGSVTSVSTSTSIEGQNARTWTWTYSMGTSGIFIGAARKNGGDNVPDLAFSTGTSIGGIKIRATLLSAPIAYPTLEDIEDVLGYTMSGAESYYNAKVAALTANEVRASGPLLTTDTAEWSTNGSAYRLAGGSQVLAVGNSIWSTITGNYVSDTLPPRMGSTISKDGIF